MTFEELFPPEVLEKLPPMYSTEDQEDVVVTVKLFFPSFSWTWFLIEMNVEERTAFGLVDGDFLEFGCIAIDELLATRDKLGLPIERDLYFQPISLKKLREQLGR